MAARLPEGFELRPARHGNSSTVAFVSGGDESLVLKCATAPPYLGWLRVEAEVLQRLADTELPVPEVVTAERGPHGVWLLLRRLPGEPLCDVLPREPADTCDWLQRAGALLGRIHTTPVPRELLDRDSTPWWQRPRVDLPSSSGGEVLGASRLVGDPPPAVFVHGDFTLDNVLAGDGRLTGVVDWGGAGRGDPRYDLALALLSAGGGTQLPAADAVQAFYAGYLQAVAGHSALHDSIAEARSSKTPPPGGAESEPGGSSDG